MTDPVKKYIHLLTDFTLKEDEEVDRMTPEERSIYRQGLKDYRDLSNMIRTAYEDGYKKGIKKGIEEVQRKQTDLPD